MTVTASPKPLHRTRHWVLAPIIVAFAVRAAGSGAGIASADTTDEAGKELFKTAAGIPWRVHNFTDQALTSGEFHRDQGANVGSATEAKNDAAQHIMCVN